MDVTDISTSILVTLDIILFVISVVGNTLVLVVMHRTKSKQASRNIYLISITLVDLATAIYAIPLGLFRTLSPYLDNSFELCIYLTSFNGILCLVQMNLLVAFTVERHKAVYKPMKYLEHRRSGHQKWIIFSCVALAVAFALPVSLGWHNEVSGSCVVEEVFTIGFLRMTSLWIILLSLVLVVASVKICSAISDHSRKVRPMLSQETVDRRIQQDEDSITNTMLMVIASYLVTWMPITLNFIVVAVIEDPRWLYGIDNDIGYVLGFAEIVATHINMAADPVIYAFRIRYIGEEMKKMLKLPQLRCEPEDSEKELQTK